MKKQLIALAAAAAILLSGCSSLLDRDYSYVTAHNTTPTAAEGDPSILRAENYQELVNALVYFVAQGTQEGTVRLYGEWEDVEADLDAACLEVVQEDPLGAYAVEYMKYSVTSVVTYYEADIQPTYRRSREQVDSIVSATGTTAIRNELESALADFASEQVLRISYFNEDENYIRTLCQEAYCATPATALDMPEVEVAIYPDSGQQRIVEILLTYHLDQQELARRSDLVRQAVADMASGLSRTGDKAALLRTAQAVLEKGGYDPAGGATAYHALLEGSGNSQGISLAFALVCQALGTECMVVPGLLGEQPHYWTVVSTPEGWRHLDLTRLDGSEDPFLVDSQMEEAGFSWDTGIVPRCRQAS